ncbi:nitrous oxide reductase accessory protein NosL [Peribacillus loiseleuriae]|uniref:Lipoprotein n=1 Tax=Peribacillus loiseleuriae TaxID=1679170 RepID=A0A0K9GTJ0_9BACI|nr:nitrous oxide reductase accessory protein NosL [Peribacillus loiseleuriae]KMY49956.1 lipoprotein [Peribacillus loiseleuriae]
MKKKRFSFIVWAGLIMILAACGNDKAQPVAINEATDTCETCNMAVIDNQHATQIILENGKSMVFDDLGCMYEWITKHENEKIDAEFVRDYHDKEWILVDDATYVYNQSLKTPMAYHVISFKDKATAEDFAAKNEGSEIMTAKNLADHDWKSNHDKEDHSHTHDENDGHSHSH